MWSHRNAVNFVNTSGACALNALKPWINPQLPQTAPLARPGLGDHVKDFSLRGLRAEDPREAEAVPGTLGVLTCTLGELDNCHLQQISADLVSKFQAIS